jgi:hypothetical protein
MLDFAATTSMAGRREKLSGTRGPLSGARWHQEQWLCSNLLMTMQKVAMYGLSGASMCHVYQVSLVGCTSI